MRTLGAFMGCTALVLTIGLSYPALSQDIDFGDDSSRWANDGQCDDPRFEGPGAALIRIPADQMRDASDCQAAFDAGSVTLAASSGSSSTAPQGEIDFGDDSSIFANDGECDDPRFEGPGMASSPHANHELRDASDCRSALEAGEISLIGGDAVPGGGDDSGIDFGDDSGNWANDGECDDPRFGGFLDSHRLADATDCRNAYEAGEVAYLGEDDGSAGDASGDIDFGDDSGSWANDGECDDPRFGGSLESHRLADATDCRNAYEAGEVTFQDAMDTGDIDFGNDDGILANDGECDDPRFGGGYDSQRFADATDCRTAFTAGEVEYIEQDATDASYPIVIDGIDFGNDDGSYANDGECDDARFEGSGMGAALDSHIEADATDCSQAYLEGTVTLIDDSDPSPQESTFRINFGDDSSTSALDGVCDDPRFQGRGGAMELFDYNVLADATDCRAAYDAGTVTYVP